MKKRGDDRKWLARVLAIGTECDIALLTGARTHLNVSCAPRHGARSKPEGAGCRTRLD